MGTTKFRNEKPNLTELWRSDDDWTKIDDKEERKRIQNRLNQRIYRRTHGSKKKYAAVTKKRPFQVERFRITEILPERPDVVTKETPKSTSLDVQDQSGISTPPSESALHVISIQNPGLISNDLDFGWLESSLGEGQLTPAPPGPTSTPNTTDHDASITALHMSVSSPALDPDQFNSSTTYFPLSADHLLHLIHYNVYRAFLTNKTLLNSSALLFKIDLHLVIPQYRNLCDGHTVLHPKQDAPLPSTLQPTPVQMNIAHSSWVNALPFPKIRDSLIQNQDNFSHSELCNDLFGDLRRNSTRSLPSSPETYIPNSSFDDGIASQTNGLIVWGEPWNPESWEATPSFLFKWSWLLKDCEELIASTNRWRAERYEDPLLFPGFLGASGLPSNEDPFAFFDPVSIHDSLAPSTYRT